MLVQSKIIFVIPFLLHFANSECSGKAGVYLSVSSVKLNRIELNWYGIGLEDVTGRNQSTYIALYDYDPSSKNPDRDSALVKIHPEKIRGHRTTNYRTAGYKETTTTTTDYWIAYVHDDRFCVLNSLRTNPNWMSDRRDCLNDKTLPEIRIPGAHGAAAYDRDGDESIIGRYTITQQLDVFEQLVHGIRYLDLRVSFRREDDDFYVVHGEFFVRHRFASILDQIGRFVNDTDEIVVVSVGGFKRGFADESIHRRLIRSIHGKLDGFLIPRSYGYDVTFRKLWQQNRRILLTYSNKIYEEYPSLWPKFNSVYANTNDVDKLMAFLDRQVAQDRPRDRLSGIGLQLTPQMIDVAAGILDRSLGLRKFADESNRVVTEWMRDVIKRLNIFSVDYFRGSDVVDIAIGSMDCQRDL